MHAADTGAPGDSAVEWLAGLEERLAATNAAADVLTPNTRRMADEVARLPPRPLPTPLRTTLHAASGHGRQSQTMHAGGGSIVGIDYPHLEDVLRRFVDPERCTVNKTEFLRTMEASGLLVDDPRIRESMSALARLPAEVGFEVFKDAVSANAVLIDRAVSRDFVIADFPEFCADIHAMYEDAKRVTDGKVATYIPQLARVDPNQAGGRRAMLCAVRRPAGRGGAATDRRPVGCGDLHDRRATLRMRR